MRKDRFVPHFLPLVVHPIARTQLHTRQALCIHQSTWDMPFSGTLVSGLLRFSQTLCISHILRVLHFVSSATYRPRTFASKTPSCSPPNNPTDRTTLETSTIPCELPPRSFFFLAHEKLITTSARLAHRACSRYPSPGHLTPFIHSCPTSASVIFCFVRYGLQGGPSMLRFGQTMLNSRKQRRRSRKPRWLNSNFPKSWW